MDILSAFFGFAICLILVIALVWFLGRNRPNLDLPPPLPDELIAYWRESIVRKDMELAYLKKIVDVLEYPTKRRVK